MLSFIFGNQDVKDFTKTFVSEGDQYDFVHAQTVHAVYCRWCRETGKSPLGLEDFAWEFDRVWHRHMGSFYNHTKVER